MEQKYWVAFTDQTDLPFLRVLRRGFRHCFVLVHDGLRWISLDPLAGHTELNVYHELASDFDFPEHLQKMGHIVVEVPTEQAAKKLAPPMLFTCVEAVKRLIGLHAAFIFTPWQLYRHLIRINQIKIKETSNG